MFAAALVSTPSQRWHITHWSRQGAKQLKEAVAAMAHVIAERYMMALAVGAELSRAELN